MCFFPFLAFSQLPLMDLSSNPENIKKFRLFFLELSKDHRKFSVISCVNTRDHRKFSVISCLLQKKHSLNFLIFSVLLDRSIEGNCLIATEVHNFLLTHIYQYNSTMVICWHRAKIEIFLETLEKLPSASQVFG